MGKDYEVISPVNALVFAIVGQNKDEFGKEAREFCAHHGIPTKNLIEWHPPKRSGTTRGKMFGMLLDEISERSGQEVDLIAFFCHGHPDRLQIGLDLDNAQEFAETCAGACSDDVRIVVYSCSAADNAERDLHGDGPATDGGLCDVVRDELCMAGLIWCQVDGHKIAGHTTRNPTVVRFSGDGFPEGGIGGRWLVQYASRQQRKKRKVYDKWARALEGGMRFDFPMLSDFEIASILEAAK